jgi:hypothetical protein
MKKQSLIIALALALVTGSAFAGTGVQWLTAGEHDLVADRLNADIAALPASRHGESAPINFAWAAPADYAGQSVQSISVESRQYWVDIDGRSLAEGIELPTTAPGAVIRISALDSGSQLQLDAARLELAIDGHNLGRAELHEVVTGAELQEQGLSVPSDTLAFRVPQDAPSGLLKVRLDGAPDQQAMVVHVFEPDSNWVAQLSAGRSNFLAGQPIDFELSLSNGKHRFAVDSRQAFLVSPDASESWTLAADGEHGRLHAAAPISQASAPGLYEAHVYVDQRVGDLTVRRDLKLAFSVAPAAGRFTGQVSRIDGPDLGLGLGVEVAAAGRYQVNGEVYGTNADGQLQPLAFVQSASVLEAGQGRIALSVDEATLAASGLGAPFEVLNLQLLDQGRMYLLEERQRAVVIHDSIDHPRRATGTGHFER